MTVRPILTTTTAVTADPTAGGPGVQCGGLRRTRVLALSLEPLRTAGIQTGLYYDRRVSRDGAQSR